MAGVEWIKITTNIFDDEKIKLIDAMPERDTIFYVWIRLLVQAGKTNVDGYIFLTENIPYTDEMLSTLFNRQINSVRFALKILHDFKMIQIFNDNFISITNWEKHQNVDELKKIREQTKKRVANYRANKKKLKGATIETCMNSIICNEECNVDVTLRNAIEGEEEIEVDREIEEISTTATIELDKSYLEFFNKNFYSMTPFENETLKNYENDGINPEVITLALQQAVEANKKDMRYVKKILDRWFSSKIFTVEAVIDDKANFEKNKKSVRGPKKQSKISTFNDFQQRSYDFQDLKKKLLGWDK